MPSSPPLRGPSLRIIAFNDVYSLENLPRLRSLVLHHAQAAPADLMLVTLAGDFLAPSLLSSLDAGRGMVDCLNALGVTHVTFGNHEDDIPTEQLRRRTAEFEATWLATNARGFEPPLPASQIVEVRAPGGRSVRVGLVGVVMRDPAVYHRKPFGGVALDPPNESARSEAARLLGEGGCAAVLPLTHQAVGDDRRLAHEQRDPPFPVILGGHEHEPLLEQIGGTWLVKAGSDAQHAVVVDLLWPPAPRAAGAPDPPGVSVRLDDVARYPEDLAMRERVTRHMAAVHALETATLAALGPGETLSSVGSRMRQTTMGTLVCSRLRDALSAEGCVVNGGGIRAARDYAGRVTYGDVKAELPFDNELVLAVLPGRVLAEAVKASRAQAPAESGGFLQVDDHMRLGEGGELLSVCAGPFDPERGYRIALVRDLFFGLDHIEPLERFAREHPEAIPAAGSGREIKLVLVDAFSVALYRKLGGFDAVDENHDGVLTGKELESAVARYTREPPSEVTAGLLLRALDTNHDQLVSREESDAAGKGARCVPEEEPKA